MSQIECRPVAHLRPWPKNARTHSRKPVRQIADSIARYIFTDAERIACGVPGGFSAPREPHE